MLQYRKEIDGLRAIAVLPVIFFHAGFSGFSGGYVGVDVFFVISGYLITSIIIDEISRQKFSIVNFYERRARRILPALSFVLIFTIIAAYILLPPDPLKLFSQSVVSVMLFSSNIYFYIKSGYFSPASEEIPLLHTWSLAVEEQYYVFFPLLVVFLWGIGKKWLLAGILLIALFSLVTAQYMANMHYNDANFYLIFSRAWELMFGSAIAFIPKRYFNVSKQLGDLLGFIGIALITYSIVFFDRNTPFPSFYALLPVVGACLVIIFVNQNSHVGRIMASRTFVFVGLISYSLYLWHQPLFAFLRFKTIGEPSELAFLFAIFLTFVFAYLSWQYIESPFRNKKKVGRSTIFTSSIAVIVLFISFGVAGHYYKGFEDRFDVPSYSDSITYSPKRYFCHTVGMDYLKPDQACRFFEDKVTWAAFGDSHMVEPSYALASKLKEHDLGLHHLSFSACPPSLLFETGRPGCSQWIKDSLEYLKNSKEIENVFLGFRYSSFLFGDQQAGYPQIPNRSPIEEYSDDFRKSLTEDPREIYWKSLKTMIEILLEAGKKVYILYPVPELPTDITKVVTPFSIFHNDALLDLNKTTSAEYYFKRHEFILNKLDSLAYGQNLFAVKPFDILCSEGYCPAVKEGKSLYFDDDHLSLYGAGVVVESIAIND